MASCFDIYSLKLTSISYVSSADHLKICVCVNQTILPHCYCILIVIIDLAKSKHKASGFVSLLFLQITVIILTATGLTEFAIANHCVSG